MPAVNPDGWHLTAVEVAYPPGDEPGPHRHPAFVVGYVLRGQYHFAVNDEPPQELVADYSGGRRSKRITALRW